ncbi:MAG TPA: hypothetical protein PK808_10290, partial [Polymorphobacter sp.]|nr:hypothetical protein [Polymorphobacter sp.]
MSFRTPDRVLETSTTAGAGAFALAGAVTGFTTFAATLIVGDLTYYAIEGADAVTGVPTGEWETGIGTYSAANTLTRTAVVASSNGGAAVNFSAGTKRVMISPLGSRYFGVKVDVFNAPGGTFTLDKDAVAVEVILIAAGGG